MSPQVDNFVHSLVEMAKAQEMLPSVQHELAVAQSAINDLYDRINSLGADLVQSRNYAATLEQRCRDLEVARDDAELRFLELDEKAAKVIAWAHQIGDMADSIEAKLEAPKPEPVKEPEPFAITEDQPTAPSTPYAPYGFISTDEQDQSESSPTITNQDASTTMTEGSPNATTAVNTDTVSTKPYTGKLYTNYYAWVSRMDWIDGGGTNETYDWRDDGHSSLPKGITSRTA